MEETGGGPDRSDAAAATTGGGGPPGSVGRLKTFWDRAKGHLLPVLTVFSVIGGVVFGLALRFSSSTRYTICIL